MSTPIVSLIGQPNVGKSSLFNMLVGKKSAIVNKKSGVTRDRKFSMVYTQDHNFWIVDTAGIADENDKLSTAMYEQSKTAANQASLVLLVVDGSQECQKEDITLARFVQKANVPILLVINKHDITDPADVHSYKKMGIKNIIQVSCQTKHGREDLLSSIIQTVPHKIEDEKLDTKLTVTIVGKPNAGKSTLTNLYAKEDRCIVSNIPGTTRDSIATDLEHRGVPYTLIDTAGMRRKARIHEDIEQIATHTALRAIESSHTVIHLVDATEEIARQDFRIIHLCLNMGKSVIVAINKIDCLSNSERKHVKKNVLIALSHLQYVPIIEISASKGVYTHQLMQQSLNMGKSMHKTFSTSMLTRILERLVKATPPPTRLGRPINLRMAHTSRSHPLQITVRGKRTSYLPKSYIRYLTKGFIDQLGLKGRYIDLVLQSDHNPYDDK
tara:strand:- start:614 stop:1933 length:1320 start_codon:yes stop_codon:yes gene_type:complete